MPRTEISGEGRTAVATILNVTTSVRASQAELEAARPLHETYAKFQDQQEALHAALQTSTLGESAVSALRELSSIGLTSIRTLPLPTQLDKVVDQLGPLAMGLNGLDGLPARLVAALDFEEQILPALLRGLSPWDRAVAGASEGDQQAIAYLADEIPWTPRGVSEARRHRALRQAVSHLAGHFEVPIPVLIGNNYERHPDGSIVTIVPYDQLGGDDFDTWLLAEAPFIAEQIYLGQRPTVMVRLRAPASSGELRFVSRLASGLARGRVTVVFPSKGGRPQVFPTGAYMIEKLEPIIRDLIKQKTRPSLDVVGHRAYEQGILGGTGSDPGRTLQNAAKRHFGGWQEFMRVVFGS